MLNKATGIVLLVAGGVLVLMGYNESQTLGSQLTRLYSGERGQLTYLYYIGGGICTFLGIVNLLRR